MKGPKGELQTALGDLVGVKVENNQVIVEPRDDSKPARAAWGLSRTLVDNMVQGVTQGFSRTLEITGVGYRAAAQGRNCSSISATATMSSIRCPRGVTVTTPRPTEIQIAGIDKQQVGQVAAEIRAWRPPEPYKGKGVRYAGEYIHRKEGKKK